MIARLAFFLALVALPAAAQPDPKIVRELREGGLVIYIRHTSTDFSKNDANMKSFEDCANQRPLTDKGRDEARAIAAHLRRLSIPVGEVFASPYCRTMETARLAFGKAEPTSEARGGPARPDDPARYDPLRKLLGAPVPKGQNRAISSHGNPFHAVAGPPYLAEGEIAIVRPEGGMKFRVETRIRLEDWSSLAASGGPAS
jgi:hypothetical protein